jgi:hypothetical protein
MRQQILPSLSLSSSQFLTKVVAMIVRSVVRCSRKLKVPPYQAKLRYARPQCRSYSASASGSPSTALGSTTAGMLAPFVTELDRIAPYFNIKGSEIQVLRSPAEFYETLKVLAHGSGPVETQADVTAVESHTQCADTDIPLYAVYWKVGE